MENLKTLRIEHNLSQQALGELLNVSQQSIYKYENDIIQPNIDTLKSMADFFNVSVDYLIDYTSVSHKIEEVTETALNTRELEYLRLYRSLPASTQESFTNLMAEFQKKSRS